MYVLNENYCCVVIILPFFIIYYLYIHLSLLLLWNLYGFFLKLIGHLVDYIDTHIFIIYFEILSVGSTLLIAFLIAVCCEVPQPIMDVALYKQNIIIL